MKYQRIFFYAAALSLLSAGANAQSRGDGWEFGADLLYLNGQDVDFDGGSNVDFDSDIGVSLYVGYRFSDKLEAQFGLDWSNVDYDATLVRDPIGSVGVSGEMEAFTPFARVNFNFIDGPITPFITGGIGWAFIDTNIPDGRPTTGCWWDPWYGYICTTVQDTHSTDSFTYNAGLGVRWDLSTGYSMRLSYEKHWYDLDNASPDFDQFKLGFVMRY
jgi:opacity protein-like surface antigen